MASTAALPARKRLSNQVQIIDHAARLFMLHGYGGTSIDMIAQSMECTKGYIYNYFDNKIQIYFAIHRKAMENCLAAIEPTLHMEIGPADKLRRMVRAHVQLIVDETHLSRASVLGLELHTVDRVAPEERAELRQINAMRERYERTFRTVVQAGVDSHAFRPCDAGLVTKALLGALNWTVLWYDPDAKLNKRAARSAMNEVLNFVLAGVGVTQLGS